MSENNDAAGSSARFGSRPALEGRKSSHLPPHLRKSITNLPVTPEINPQAYFETTKRTALAAPRLDSITSTSSAESDSPDRGSTPLKEGDSSGQSAGPTLSGKIISATHRIPQSPKWRLQRDGSGGEWDLKTDDQGAPALFDTLRLLSSADSSWNHTIVAWTGEIEETVAENGDDEPPPSPSGTSPSGLQSLIGSLVSSAPSSAPATDSPPPSPTRAAAVESRTSRTDDLFIPEQDMRSLERQLAHDAAHKMVPVWLGSEELDESGRPGLRLKDQSKWGQFAEHEMYPLFHYKQPEPSDGNRERVEWADYCRMNEAFADRILEIYRPGDIVLVHDYQLMLLPRILRQRVRHIYVGFVLYCPFPSSELVKCMSRRKEILEGILGSDLVGFQAHSYGSHFASCCTRILGFPSDDGGVETDDGMLVSIATCPLGIDAALVESSVFSDTVSKKHAALKDVYRGMKIIVGRDRMDGVDGLTHKLGAFERFLDMYPEWRGKVVLIQVTDATTISARFVRDVKADPAAVKYARDVSQAMVKINGKYGNLGYTPVRHYPRYLRQDEYFALLRAGDICLSTSTREGASNVSLGYIVSQRDDHGQLIMSELSGTADSLRGVTSVNPWDWAGIAVEINRALEMAPEQKQAAQQSLYQQVTTTHSARYWIDRYLEQLVDVLASTRNAGTVVTPPFDRFTMMAKCRATTDGKRLFLFDYDGTLTPIVQDPAAALPSDKLIASLGTLAGDSHNSVYVISGRDQAFLEQHLGHIKGLGLVAEHGSFLRRPCESEWTSLSDAAGMGWLDEVSAVYQKYTDMIPGSVIERKKCAITWHYRQAADYEKAAQASRECQKELELGVAAGRDIRIMTGKANIEVRPAAIDKGEVARRLVRDENAGFLLCAGDDTTDEDMFCALHELSSKPRTSKPGKGEQQQRGADLQPDHVFTVTVGPESKPTLAKSYVPEAEDMIECLGLLAGLHNGRKGSMNGARNGEVQGA